MRLVSRMTMSRFGLTLYFLAFTDEDIPTPLDSETNRKWLWTRQYTQIELQYWHDFEPSVCVRVCVCVRAYARDCVDVLV